MRFQEIHIPDATTSVLINVAIALIQFACPFSAETPCANGFMQSGFFFMALHTHNDLDGNEQVY